MQLLSMSVQELSEYIDSSIESNPLLQKEFSKKKPPTKIDSSLKAAKPIQQDENPRLSLISQIRMLGLDEKTSEIAEYLIYEMDDNGYIKADLDEVAENFFVNVEKIEDVLSVIQSLDPPGIGARDTRECLKLQLKRMGKEGSLEYVIVTDFINELARNDVEKISRAVEASDKEVINAIKNIKKLNPKPAGSLLAKKEESVIPDLIANIKSDKIRLELNREWLPRLRLYNPYEKQLEVIKDARAKEFLRKNINEAKSLIDGLKRREETMCRVADYILKFQKDCLEKDLSQINGLTINDVASALGFHPSTISRTISNKYIELNGKVVALKNLLSHSIKKENGESASKSSVKGIIKQLIENDDKARPLSDSAIQKKLEAEGITIKRRTVAKYRESLRILPSHLRRKKSLS